MEQETEKPSTIKYTEGDLSKMTVVQLKKLLQSKGLPSTGIKQNLISSLLLEQEDTQFIERLESDHFSTKEGDSQNEITKMEDNLLLDETWGETSISDENENKTNQQGIVTSTPVQKVLNVLADDNNLDSNSKAAKKSHIDFVAVRAPPLKDDEQRKQMRAERFSCTISKNVDIGIVNKPSTDTSRLSPVRISKEGSKVALRGDKPAVSGTEYQLLKKRAERFGVLSNKLKQAEEQEKLKKRKSKFGLGNDSPGSDKHVGDDEEARKRKKRAERFG